MSMLTAMSMSTDTERPPSFENEKKTEIDLKKIFYHPVSSSVRESCLRRSFTL